MIHNSSTTYDNNIIIRCNTRRQHIYFSASMDHRQSRPTSTSTTFV
ncbi:Protein of unknown function [Pyronema omphalodes CBS 100304]|uniref:Uncharacterized protein n=1 Tax=Pyronema omphalodes (strain CBS 100304) TaxID=1076935 RepID=U4KVD3_PYROM|nr:Protein of unknown function [Pyronema omphalodes CBS 100304]